MSGGARFKFSYVRDGVCRRAALSLGPSPLGFLRVVDSSNQVLALLLSCWAVPLTLFFLTTTVSRDISAAPEDGSFAPQPGQDFNNDGTAGTLSENSVVRDHVRPTF